MAFCVGTRIICDLSTGESHVIIKWREFIPDVISRISPAWNSASGKLL